MGRLLKCKVCDWSKDTTARGLTMHMHKAHSNGEAKPRGIGKLIKVDYDLATVLSVIYPKGIPTGDVELLAATLREINTLRERLMVR